VLHNDERLRVPIKVDVTVRWLVDEVLTRLRRRTDNLDLRFDVHSFRKQNGTILGLDDIIAKKCVDGGMECRIGES
jgi:hypothetical protein